MRENESSILCYGIRDALSYIETNILVSKTVKIDGQAEANRFYNYPYNALEEAVVNAVFHKSYRDGEPVEIRIYTDSIVIINFPGPAAYISMEKFSAGKARPRKYRNRRIGEFFQQIELSEKQATGISKILRVLKINGSPTPEFETDDARTYLETTIRIRDGFKMSDKMSEQEQERIMLIVANMPDGGVSSKEAAVLLNVEQKTASRLLAKAVELGIFEGVGGNRNRRYIISDTK